MTDPGTVPENVPTPNLRRVLKLAEEEPMLTLDRLLSWRKIMIPTAISPPRSRQGCFPTRTRRSTWWCSLHSCQTVKPCGFLNS